MRIPRRMLVVCLLAIATTVAAAPDARRPPNFVVLLTDDQRHDTLDSMPAVTRLAEQGLRFDNGFVTSPVCGPSRASLLTGRLASSQGIFVNEGASAVFDASDTIAVRLQDAGYVTALFGKYLNGYRDQYPAVPPGWDDWRVFRDHVFDLFGAGSLYRDALMSWNGRPVRPPGYTTDLLADYAVEFIEAHAEEPFFLMVSFWGSHAPLVPAERHRGAMMGRAPPLPPSFAEPDMSDKPVLPGVFATGNADFDTFRDYWNSTWPPYLEVLLSVDEAVGRIDEKLRELGLSENTVVIFTSDNGLLLGEHWWIGKGLPYEESIRVPMVLRYPARVVPRRSDALVLNIDVAPTLAELAGVEMPADGHSLVPLFARAGSSAGRRPRRPPGGRSPPWRRAAPLEWFSQDLNPGFTGFRFRDSKVVLWDDGSVEFYRLGRDPWELENLRRR